MKLLLTAALVSLGTTCLLAHEPEKDSSTAGCPMINDHAAMNHRGDQGMGFSQEKTTHHFRLAADGGAIEVSANDPNDTTNRDQIRMHLGHIAKMFAEGNFEIPMFVHDKTPDGAAVMKKDKATIGYTYEEMKNGGRVCIRTSNPEALKAVHDFLRFQITEHQTGDSTAIGPKS
jgi:hypothetical protein